MPPVSEKNLKEGLDGTYYPPFPVLGLATDHGNVFLAAGGGGALSAKEVPNVVQAFQYDEATGKLSTVASLSTDKEVVVGLQYAKGTDQYLASANGNTRVIKYDGDAKTLTELYQLTTEREGKEPTQNVAQCSPSGDLIATGGTDGVIKLHRVADKQKEPTLEQECRVDPPLSDKQKEVLELDFSADGKLLVSVDRSGCGRVWSCDTGKQVGCITYSAKGQPLPIGGWLVRQAKFVPKLDDVSPAIVVGASGMRGPCYIATYSIDGNKMHELLLGKMPLRSLCVSPSAELCAVCLSNGEKRVYSLPKLKKVKEIKDAHDMPAPALAFIGENTVVSASGDYTIHLMNYSGSGSSMAAQKLTLLAIIMIVTFLVMRWGFLGVEIQQQGNAEL